MLYKENAFTKELFANPTAEYRGTPFWAWNCKMTKESVDYSIDALEAMGMETEELVLFLWCAKIY